VNESNPDGVFKINLASGDKVVITLTGTGGDVDLYLFPPGSTTVASGATASSVQEGNNEQISITIPSTGEWYIDVYSFSGSTNYTLTVTVQ
jgi:vibriolysin